MIIQHAPLLLFIWIRINTCHFFNEVHHLFKLLYYVVTSRLLRYQLRV